MRQWNGLFIECPAKFRENEFVKKNRGTSTMLRDLRNATPWFAIFVPGRGGRDRRHQGGTPLPDCSPIQYPPRRHSSCRCAVLGAVLRAGGCGAAAAGPAEACGVGTSSLTHPSDREGYFAQISQCDICGA